MKKIIYKKKALADLQKRHSSLDKFKALHSYAIAITADALTFDADSDCFKELVEATRPMVIASSASAPARPTYDPDEQKIIDLIDDDAKGGLGDNVKTVIEGLIDALGKDRAAKLRAKLASSGCGCAARQKWLNKFWPRHGVRNWIKKLVTPTDNRIPLNIRIYRRGGVLRDLHLAHPNKYRVEVRGWCADLFIGSPYDDSISKQKPQDERGYDKDEFPLAVHLNQYGTGDVHLQDMFRRKLEAKLKVSIPVTRIGGDLRLTDEEKKQALPWGDQPYWILNAGSKTSPDSLTVKQPDVAELQKVIDHFREKILFVQVGSKYHRHPRLDGAFDFIEGKGEATFRKARVAMYRAQGVISPISWPMHLAAALELPNWGLNRAAMCGAGGREGESQYDSVSGSCRAGHYWGTAVLLVCCLLEEQGRGGLH